VYPFKVIQLQLEEAELEHQDQLLLQIQEILEAIQFFQQLHLQLEVVEELILNQDLMEVLEVEELTVVVQGVVETLLQ
jgi:hypothetical protein